jgi:rSAM/selenodomain-associated transferase 1
MAQAAIVVIAKAPAPGRSKTRLCPPCTPKQAAELAAAALGDTLAAVAATPARRRIVALDGDPDGWLPPGFELHPQRGSGLGERLGDALVAAGGPALVVGMDTPQLSPALLGLAAARLGEPGVDAVLGPAFDGGYWTIGLRRPDPAVFDGVPMSSADTGAVQRSRLAQLGLRTAELPVLRDVDTMEDAVAVARERPSTRFAAALRRLEPVPGVGS